MGRYFLGVDNGGTLSKAAIFNEQGVEVARCSTSMQAYAPHPGYSERDMEQMWQATASLIAATIKKSGVKAEEIAGVACTGHGKGLYLWSTEDKPLGMGIISTDTRAWEYPLRWKEDGTSESVFEKTFQEILACQPVSLLNWIIDHQPGRLDSVKWIFEAKDYIRFRLTGEPLAEITDYSGSNLLNCATRSFDSTLLDLFELAHLYPNLPPLVMSTQYAGSISRSAAELTGLKEGTPVAGGMFDIDACAIAMGITDEQHVAVIAGTWSINEYISKRPVLNHSVMMNSLYCLDDYYVIEESSPTSAGNHAWFIETFLAEERQEATKRGMHPYAWCDTLAANVGPHDHSIIFLPYLYGSTHNPRGKASLIGVGSHHTRAHMIRAVLEGITFGHKIHVNRLLANRDKPESIRLAGGVVASPLWAQMFSNIFELPVETVEASELGAFGAAMSAAVASGTYADLEQAAAHMVCLGKTYTPNAKEGGIYQEKFALFDDITKTLDPYWSRFSESGATRGEEHEQ